MGDHHLHFSRLKPQDVSEGGYRIKASKKIFPALENMSLYKVVLYTRGVREPHWHANADELGVCLQGKVIVSFYGNQNQRESFVVDKGEAFYIPSGVLHSIENIGGDTAELILSFSNEETEDFALSTTLDMFSDAVLGNTWGVSSAHFKSLPRPLKETFIGKAKASSQPEKEGLYPSKYRFALEASAPIIQNEGGEAKVARQDVWPILRRQAVYSLHLTGVGMREPHWHPETAELGYVTEGKGRMSILSPSGTIDTYEMEKGDLYFIPKAYPHHIENLTDQDLNILIFFDQPMPGDVGFTASIKSFAPAVLTASIPGPKDLFDKLPTYTEDLFIVKKVNPVDP